MPTPRFTAECVSWKTSSGTAHCVNELPRLEIGCPGQKLQKSRFMRRRPFYQGTCLRDCPWDLARRDRSGLGIVGRVLDHITIRASDRAASDLFYDVVLRTIGVEQTGRDET